MYRKVLLFFGVVGVSLSLALGLSLVVTWEVVAVLIAVSIGVPSLILTQVNIRPRREKTEREQEITTDQKDVIIEETIHIGREQGHSYEFEPTGLKRGDHLEGEISSDIPVNIYFVNDINFKKWQRDKTFNAEYYKEWILETRIDVLIPRKGKWYLLVENAGKEPATVKIHIY